MHFFENRLEIDENRNSYVVGEEMKKYEDLEGSWCCRIYVCGLNRDVNFVYATKQGQIKRILKILEDLESTWKVTLIPPIKSSRNK